MLQPLSEMCHISPLDLDKVCSICPEVLEVLGGSGFPLLRFPLPTGLSWGGGHSEARLLLEL